MLRHNRPAEHGTTQFRKCLERIEQQRDKEQTALGKGACGILAEVEIQGAEHDSDDDAAEPSKEEVEAILQLEGELTLHKCPNLQVEADLIDRSLGGTALALLDSSLEVVVSIGLLRKRSLILGHFSLERRPRIRLLESLRQRLGVVRRILLRSAGGIFPLPRIRATGEVICARLSGTGCKAKTLEVTTGRSSGSEIDLSSFVDHHDLVEEFVDVFGSLVQGDKGGGLVEDGGVGDHALCDTDSLALSSRNTADEVITNDGVAGMFDVEHLEKHTNDALLELLLAHVSRSLSRHLGLDREPKGLFDRQGRMMDVIFGVVNSFSSVLVKVLVRPGAVENLSLHRSVAIALIGDGLEESGAARAGFAQNENHLTGLDHAAETVKKSNLRGLGAKAKHANNRADNIEEANEGIGKGRDKVRHAAIAPDGQPIPAATKSRLEIKQRLNLSIISLGVLLRIDASSALPATGARYTSELPLKLCEVGLGLFNRHTSVVSLRVSSFSSRAAGRIGVDRVAVRRIGLLSVVVGGNGHLSLSKVSFSHSEYKSVCRV
ncbi:hypothetical protein HG530_002653 [Fusarium avenaceum]|nr:hypothetical protein HG530_002653 [Fusarium avenaceum]